MTEPDVVLDPDGDLLVILRNPSNIPDPHEYLVFPEPANDSESTAAESSDDEKEATVESGSEEDAQSTHSDMSIPLASLSEVHYKVSSKHLSLASFYVRFMLNGPWMEATKVYEDGLRHWVLEGFDANAMNVVLSIIHHKHDNVPRQVWLDMLVEIARIVDYIGCYDVMVLYANVLWIPSLKHAIPKSYNVELMLWICVAGVFREKKIFKECTRLAIIECHSGIPTLGLPVLPQISDEINQRRERCISKMFASIDDLVECLTRGNWFPTGCCFVCDATFLGLVIKRVHGKIPSPRPTSPYVGLSVGYVIDTLRSVLDIERQHGVMPPYQESGFNELESIADSAELAIKGLDIKSLKQDPAI